MPRAFPRALNSSNSQTWRQNPLCQCCETLDRSDLKVLSLHRTSTGVMVWLRCVCGSLQALSVGPEGTEIVAFGSPR